MPEPRHGSEDVDAESQTVRDVVDGEVTGSK